MRKIQWPLAAGNHYSIGFFIWLTFIFSHTTPPNVPPGPPDWHCPDQPAALMNYCVDQNHPHYHLSNNTAADHWVNPDEDGGHVGVVNRVRSGW